MPRYRPVLILSALLLALAGCQGVLNPPGPTATPVPPLPTPVPPIPVDINTGDVRQTLREVGGGNYIHFFGGVTDALDPVSTLNLDTLNPQVVRVRIDLDEWQPEEGGDFQVGPHVQATFEFMKEVRSRSPEAVIIASIWKVPDWMVSNPEKEQPRLLKKGYEEKVVAAIGRWLLRAKEAYGVEVDDISFNEADIGITVSLTPTEQIAMIRQGGPQLQKMGLKTRWLLGDISNMSSFKLYVPRIYADEAIRPYLGPLSFHSWDASTPDLMLREIGAFAKENGLEVWCTEGGYDPAQWNYPEEFSTFRHAMRLGSIYTRVLRDTRATALLYWEMMGKDYFINDGEKPFPALVYLDQFKRHFPASAQIVATPDDPILTLMVLSLAAKTPGGGFSVELLNQVNLDRTVSLSGLPAGSYAVTRFTETGGLQTIDPLVVHNGQAMLDLPGQSIIFLMLQQ
jgi:hypothetical protein